VSTPSIAARLGRALAAEPTVPGERWVVAVSGGLDSVVLLHLLRFAVEAPAELVIAHFDHGMRAASRDDARWVRGLVAAWGLRVHSERAGTVPSSEAEARDARYAFLDRVRRDAGARLVVTAHHADDQAEGVLFRALRGTGRSGLAGMRARRGDLFRPLLPFWRDELEAYARNARVSWREDSTNASLDYARNALRHRVLPDIERMVAPGARRALVRLAGLAREDEEGWQSVLPGVLAPLGVEEREGALSADLGALSALHPAVRARVLRALAARLGRTLDERATRRAVELAAGGPSGQAADLGAGLVLRRDLDRVELVLPADVAADRPVHIRDAGPGAASAWLGGQEIPVAWGDALPGGGQPSASFDPERVRFPLVVRARREGDRIRLPGGTKKVKKLLLERRIARVARASVPLLVDREGAVLWIPGVARALDSPPGSGALSIRVGG
jgi:tRNA(Ile)-lysidine synthase